MKGFLPIIFIIVAIGLFFFQINPTYSEIKTLRAESAQYDEALEIASQLKELRATLAQNLAKFSPMDLEKLDKFLPQRLDTVRIILDVDGIAKKYNLQVKDIKTADNSQKQAIAGGTGTPNPYNTVSMSFKFNGTYSQAVLFLKDLEQSLRLLDSFTVAIMPADPNKDGKPQFGQYEFGVTLNTYWINR